MKESGIENNDLLLIDRSVTPKYNSIVVITSFRSDKLIIRKLIKVNGKNVFHPEDKTDEHLEIYGVVIHAIRSHA